MVVTWLPWLPKLKRTLIYMMSIVSNISGLFLLLGEEFYKDYTSRTNRAEPLTTWAVLVVVMLRLGLDHQVRAHA